MGTATIVAVEQHCIVEHSFVVVRGVRSLYLAKRRRNLPFPTMSIAMAWVSSTDFESGLGSVG